MDFLVLYAIFKLVSKPFKYFNFSPTKGQGDPSLLKFIICLFIDWYTFNIEYTATPYWLYIVHKYYILI
jgi:hypothetical protein